MSQLSRRLGLSIGQDGALRLLSAGGSRARELHRAGAWRRHGAWVVADMLSKFSWRFRVNYVYILCMYMYIGFGDVRTFKLLFQQQLGVLSP